MSRRAAPPPARPLDVDLGGRVCLVTGGNAGLVYHCGAGVNAFAVDPCGRMTLCVLSQRDAFDLREGSFKDWLGAVPAAAPRAPGEDER